MQLTLNVDWFRPFRGEVYSCGAIYLTINNLPRAVRYKKENVILVGVMPGPKEAKIADLNNYLRPLVDELHELYTDVAMKTYQHADEEVIVRAALLMVACDRPAARKVSGFTSHSSSRACYRCKRAFSSFGQGQLDFSGFNCDTWERNTWQDNVKDAKTWKSLASRAEQERHEKSTGMRWSELHRLPYLDLVRCTIIDPMHNLFLGTAKRLAEHWVNTGLITDAQLRSMQTMADDVLPPPEYE